MQINKTVFETEIQVRPDDIDMNQHVHSSRYMDYVLAARYEQMANKYKMPMEEFTSNGFGWVIKATHMEFKRPLAMGDTALVKTHFDKIDGDSVVVNFEIIKKENNKSCCSGWFHYTMINTKTGRAEIIPEWIVERYSI